MNKNDVMFYTISNISNKIKTREESHHVAIFVERKTKSPGKDRCW